MIIGRTSTVTATVRVGSEPVAVATDPHAKTVYVANLGGNPCRSPPPAGHESPPADGSRGNWRQSSPWQHARDGPRFRPRCGSGGPFTGLALAVTLTRPYQISAELAWRGWNHEYLVKVGIQIRQERGGVVQES
jgi:hypothetical protein